jgi:hypothetical protein
MGTKEELTKRGVKSSAQADRPLNFVGAEARITFAGMSERMRSLFTPTNTDVANIGDAYDTGFYQRTAGSKQRTYENVFGDIDWSRAAEDPITLQILEEAYGNNDNAPREPNIAPDDLQRIYGVTKTAPNKRTTLENSRVARDSQNTNRQRNDADTRGIRGVDEVDAPIEPFA